MLGIGQQCQTEREIANRSAKSNGTLREYVAWPVATSLIFIFDKPLELLGSFIWMSACLLDYFTAQVTEPQLSLRIRERKVANFARLKRLVTRHHAGAHC